MDLNGLALVGEYDSAFDARVAAAILGQEGIRAVLPHERRHPRHTDTPAVSLRGRPDVMDLLVPEADADRARALLGNYDEIAAGPPPPGFRDEDVGVWLEARQQREVRQRRKRARSRRIWIPVLGLLAAAMIVVAVLGAVADLP